MKIQCACGAKYAFDVTPEMAERPVRFICQSCGLDSSDAVNALIRQELNLLASAGAPPPAQPVAEVLPTAPPVSAVPPPPLLPTPVPPTLVPLAVPRLQVTRAAEPAAPMAEPATGSAAPQYCLKHRGELCTERCVVCQKPMCPKCMELFGYVCSPLCKARAEAKKIEIPVYAGQKSVVEAKFWRKTGLISGAVAAAVAGLLGLWFWYAWFGSVPHPVFSVSLTDAGFGQARLCGKNQLVLLHDGTLARYDIGSKKEVWSHQLIDMQQIKDAVAKEEQALQQAQAKVRSKTPAKDSSAPLYSEEDAVQFTKSAVEQGLQLQVYGSNVWVSAPGGLTHFDWNTGKALQQVPVAVGFGNTTPQGDELLVTGESDTGQQIITHVNLVNGETRMEAIGQPGQAGVAAARNARGAMEKALAGGTGGAATAGLPLNPGADIGKPLNPEEVAADAQSLPLPARIALPALLANTLHQERIMQEADDDSDTQRAQSQLEALASRLADKARVTNTVSLVPSQYGDLQFAVRLVKDNVITREAMKAPPARSALDSGNLNATKTADVANEILNEMQRNRGGGTVQEDQSTYQVSIRRPDSGVTPDWTGEVVGPAALFSLKTVNVLTAGKTVTVFDKSNKKLWQATLAYNVLAGVGVLDWSGAAAAEYSQYGAGPCVERGDTLYVFDQAVLTAFDAATGNVRWRLPSVGIAGLFFDDQGMLYVNSTTASPENIKYSRQIDVSQKVDDVFLKIDPKTGKILWNVKPGAPISYLSGKFIYAMRGSSGAGTEDRMAALAGINSPGAFLRIRRINPGDGRILWDYQQSRAPMGVQFHRNMIELVFGNEIQVLKFLSF